LPLAVAKIKRTNFLPSTIKAKEAVDVVVYPIFNIQPPLFYQTYPKPVCIMFISQQVVHLQSIRVQFWKRHNEIYTLRVLPRPKEHFQQKIANVLGQIGGYFATNNAQIDFQDDHFKAVGEEINIS
jgi:hypothetical protein